MYFIVCDILFFLFSLGILSALILVFYLLSIINMNK